MKPIDVKKDEDLYKREDFFSNPHIKLPKNSNYFSNEEIDQLKEIQESIENKRYFTPSLYTQRKMTIADTLKEYNKKTEIQGKVFENGKIIKQKIKRISRVLFCGCGIGGVMRYIRDDGYSLLTGLDVCEEDLECACSNLKPALYHYLQPLKSPLKVILRKFDVTKAKELNTSFVENNFDAVVCTEVIEHIEKKKLPRAIDFIFKTVSPNLIIFTTPNKDFNRWWWSDFKDWLKRVRDEDHKFEFTQEEFVEWAKSLEKQYKNYKIAEFSGVGIWEEGKDEKEKMKKGFASQTVIFEKKGWLEDLKTTENIIVNKANEVNSITKKKIQKINDRDAFKVIDYPKLTDKRSFDKKVIDELFYLYNLIIQYFTNYKKNDYVKLSVLYEKIIAKDEFKTLTQDDQMVLIERKIVPSFYFNPSRRKDRRKKRRIFLNGCKFSYKLFIEILKFYSKSHQSRIEVDNKENPTKFRVQQYQGKPNRRMQTPQYNATRVKYVSSSDDDDFFD